MELSAAAGDFSVLRTPGRMKPTLVLMAAIFLSAASAVGASQAAGPAEPSAAVGEVYTRGIVRSIARDGRKRLYVRLKLLPRANIPFSTLTYRVLDERLFTGMREGDSVAFRAERVGGENVLTVIQPAAPCERFAECK